MLQKILLVYYKENGDYYCRLNIILFSKIKYSMLEAII